MAVPTGQKIAIALCETWGLDPSRVVGVNIDLGVTGPGHVMVRMVADDGVTHILREFDLVERMA